MEPVPAMRIVVESAARVAVLKVTVGEIVMLVVAAGALSTFADAVSNPDIDGAYDAARAQGVIGGKLAGAGGGGFMMLYCRDGAQAAVTAALEARGLQRLDFRFEEGGARVLLNAGLRLPETALRAAATPPGAVSL